MQLPTEINYVEKSLTYISIINHDKSSMVEFLFEMSNQKCNIIPIVPFENITLHSRDRKGEQNGELSYRKCKLHFLLFITAIFLTLQIVSIESQIFTTINYIKRSMTYIIMIMIVHKNHDKCSMVEFVYEMWTRKCNIIPIVPFENYNHVTRNETRTGRSFVVCVNFMANCLRHFMLVN